MLRSPDWWLVKDVSGKPIGPIFKGQAVQEEFLDCSTLEDGAYMLPRNVGNYLRM
jgi:hypothetical protein